MKANRTRFVLIFPVAVIALLLGCYFFIFNKLPVKNESAQVIKFLNDFNKQLTAGNTDSLAFYFRSTNEINNIKALINILGGKKDLDAKGASYKKINLDIEGSVIEFLNNGLIITTIPVNLSYEVYPAKNSSIWLKIVRISPGKYKIIEINPQQFFADYGDYHREIKIEHTDLKITYDSLTEQAFKSAQKLKQRYDSVLWFDHVNGLDYFYVIKGSMAGLSFLRGDVMDKTKCKMGLVGPSLNEIIPVDFALIHNIGGTIDGLIEVEKDDKKGFYSIDGKLIVPVNFDQMFPLNDDANLALLRKGNDYFYLTRDLTLTDKIPDFAIAEKVPKIRNWGESYKISDSTSKSLMEYNDRYQYNSLVIPPSYLVDLAILPKFIELQNPLRHYGDESDEDGDGSLYYEVKPVENKEKENNWLACTFNSIFESYLGARAGLYEGKNVLVVDKKGNRLLGFQSQSYFGRAESGGALSGKCNDNSLIPVGDNLYEFKTTSYLDQELFDEKTQMQEGPYYHYLRIKNRELIAVKGDRIFNCTKFARMDDSYLNTCFVINNKAIDHMTPEILRYMKNEIYASYGYSFKNQRWNELFGQRYNNIGLNANVDDSLSSIEKHNIQWINSKLNGPKQNTIAAK